MLHLNFFKLSENAEFKKDTVEVRLSDEILCIYHNQFLSTVYIFVSLAISPVVRTPASICFLLEQETLSALLQSTQL